MMLYGATYLGVNPEVDKFCFKSQSFVDLTTQFSIDYVDYRKVFFQVQD